MVATDSCSSQAFPMAAQHPVAADQAECQERDPCWQEALRPLEVADSDLGVVAGKRHFVVEKSLECCLAVGWGRWSLKVSLDPKGCSES